MIEDLRPLVRLINRSRKGWTQKMAVEVQAVE